MVSLNPENKTNTIVLYNNLGSPKQLTNTDNNTVFEEKTFELPKKAVDTLKANVLYNKKDNYKQKEYIPLDATPQEVRDILADKKQVGRSFWGYKRVIKNGIKNSENPQQAIENLNFLLNAKDGKLNAQNISSILSITETINNGKGAQAEHLKKHYGFEGGKLDDNSLTKIIDVQAKDAMLLAATTSIMNQQMIQQQMQMQQQQDMLNHQIMQDTFNQQVLQNTMMTTPGMGFI